MLNKCKEALLNIQISGTRVDKRIAGVLLSEKAQKNIKKIADVAKICDISLSTASRFIAKMQYPSFKHFIYEYIPEKNKQTASNETNKEKTSYIQDVMEKSHDLVSHLKGRIFILTSRRGKSIGKFLHERLNDGKFDNELFRESQDQVEEFVQKSRSNTLILVSLSGYSQIFSHAIQAIARLEEDEKPNVIILTAAMWMSIFEKYDYISIGKLRKKKYDLDQWKEYNIALLDIMSTVIVLLNDIYDYQLNKK